MSNLIGQRDFLERLKICTEATYGLESIFTVIAIEPRAMEGGRFGIKESLGVLASTISKAIVKEGEFYSFFDDKFYILTRTDSKKVLNDFINSLAVKLAAIYGSELYIKAGFVQYPYDAMNVFDLFAALTSSMDRVVFKRYDFETGTITEKEINYTLGTELTQFLQKIMDYSEALYRHSLFVAKISLELAKTLNFANQAIKKIVIAAILHDLGYLMISKEIFSGSKQVKAQNSKTIKLHPLLATRKILQDKHIFRDVFDLIEQHHEFLDGGGYPFGLSRIDLNIESQVISLADTYALVKEQQNVSQDSIIEFFVARSGFRWDEKLVDVFVGILADEKRMAVLDNIDNCSLKELFNLS